MYNMLGVCCW